MIPLRGLHMAAMLAAAMASGLSGPGPYQRAPVSPWRGGGHCGSNPNNAHKCARGRAKRKAALAMRTAQRMRAKGKR